MKTKNVFKIALSIYPLTVLVLLIFFLLSGCESDYKHEVLMEKIYADNVCNTAIPNWKGLTIEKLESIHGKPCLISIPDPIVNTYPYKKCFVITAERYGMNPEYLAAIASVESSFNPLAKSSANAIGLMQIKWPITAQELGITNIEELYNPCKNIDLGAKYLAMLEDRFNSKLLALAAYFEGPTKVSKNKIISLKSINYIDRILSRERMLNNSL